MRSCVEQTWGRWEEDWEQRYFRDNFRPEIDRIIIYHGQDVGVLSTEERAADVFLRLIELLPTHQRLGIGTTVITGVLSKAHRCQLPVALQVLKVNPARRLYERLGFTLHGETATHYLMVARPVVELG